LDRGPAAGNGQTGGSRPGDPRGVTCRRGCPAAGAGERRAAKTRRPQASSRRAASAVS
jgi:hypothetical protein